MDALDTRIRLKAFQFLEEQCKLHGDVLPREVLAEPSSGSPAGRLFPGGGLYLRFAGNQRFYRTPGKAPATRNVAWLPKLS